MKIEHLQAIVDTLRAQLTQAEFELQQGIYHPDNNIYESLEHAEGFLYERMRDQASEDCEGSGNCGLSEYKQLFSVGDKFYEAIATVDYDRFDKQFYVIENFDFKIKEVLNDLAA